METAEEFSIILGYLFHAEKEAVTNTMVLLPIPTIRTMICVLSSNKCENYRSKSKPQHL